MGSKTQRKKREINREYYNKVLLKYLGFEKEIFDHTEHSVKFYHNNNLMILWTGANKIQEAFTGKWIIDADEFIIKNVLHSDRSAPTLKQFYGKETN